MELPNLILIDRNEWDCVHKLPPPFTFRDPYFFCFYVGKLVYYFPSATQGIVLISPYTSHSKVRVYSFYALNA